MRSKLLIDYPRPTTLFLSTHRIPISVMARRPSIKTALARLFDTAAAPMYVLDDRRRIVYCNPALADWMGSDVVDIIGQRCDYHSEPTASSVDAAYAGLCPPPEVFAGVRRSAQVTVRTRDGERRHEFVDAFARAGRDRHDRAPEALFEGLDNLKRIKGQLVETPAFIGTAPPPPEK